MRLFWSIFFLGSMLIVGFDVRERRRLANAPSPLPAESEFRASSDPFGFPTPRP